MLDIIESRIKENLSVIKSIMTDLNIQYMISYISKDVVNTIKNENKLIIAGNGGSFADSFHFAGEFVSKFNFGRESLPAHKVEIQIFTRKSDNKRLQFA